METKTKIKRTVGKDVHFQRIRRITGYLVSDTSRWNSAKLAELKERVTHFNCDCSK